MDDMVREGVPGVNKSFGIQLDDHDDDDMSKDLKGLCRNLVLRGPMMENVAQTMDSEMVNYLKR
jgi:phosphoribosylformylglycinamidine (FGAM) synthase PurS component